RVILAQMAKRFHNRAPCATRLAFPLKNSPSLIGIDVEETAIVTRIHSQKLVRASSANFTLTGLRNGCPSLGGTVMAVASAVRGRPTQCGGAFASWGGVRRFLGSNSARRVSSELSNDSWDPPPAHMFEISGVMWIGAEKAFLHKAF